MPLRLSQSVVVITQPAVSAFTCRQQTAFVSDTRLVPKKAGELSVAAGVSRRRRNIGWVVVWVGLGLAARAGSFRRTGRQRGGGILRRVFCRGIAVSRQHLRLRDYFFRASYSRRVSAPGAPVRDCRRAVPEGGHDPRGHRHSRAPERSTYPFAALILFAAWRMVFGAEREQTVVKEACNVCETWIARVVRVSPVIHGHDFWRRESGRLVATPLLVALVVIETTDIVFALDSVPAVLAITRNPFIVYTSNVMAMLGLRSLYFVLADALPRLRYLRPGLALVLVFTGTKMLVSPWVQITATTSVLVIAVVLLLTVIASAVFPNQPVRSASIGDQHAILSFQRPFGRAWRRAQSGSFVSARPNSRSRPAMSAL